MGRKEAYKILIRALLRYAWEKHPYMSAWVAACIFTGICTGIMNTSISNLISGIAAGLLPMIMIGIGRALLSLDSWERANIKSGKMRRKEAFINYIKEYTEKAVNK